jgi:hypothetical protein
MNHKNEAAPGGKASPHALTPGRVVLFGSGETSPSGHKVFDHLLQQMPPDRRVALLETPAGFELNSAQVIQRVADFIEQRLGNYHPQAVIVPARRRGTDFSPDNSEIAQLLLKTDLIFLGPGSPTYAARQLQDSLTWQYLLARHRLGSTLILASAAVVAASVQVLPVYEIYKAGHDLHWKPGLNLFGPYGLPIIFIPHWNNTDGGGELDTSRCFMGRQRFAALCELLPPGLIVLGIDEKTALIMDIHAGTGQVMGQGGISLLKTASAVPFEERYLSGDHFPLSELGPLHLPEPDTGIPEHVWQAALEAAASTIQSDGPPDSVLSLVEAREAFRRQKDWPAADHLRKKILDLGWVVSDTTNGPALDPADDRPN